MELKQDVTHGTWDYPFQVHHTELSDGLSLYPHVHEELEVTCITKGQGVFCINGHDYSVKEGSLLFIPSGSIHLATPTLHVPASFFSIVFSPYCFCLSDNHRIYTKYIAPIIDRRLFFPEYLDGSENWHTDAWNIAKEVEEASFLPEGELLSQSALLKLWSIMFQHSFTQTVKTYTDIQGMRLKDCIDYMHTHFSKHITINDLSSIAHMSDGHFSRTFKEYMKMSPIDYLIQIRIHESTKLLQKSDLPIGEIALSCGFNDFSYFSKHFRQQMKCSPREYRKKHTSV